MDNAVTEWLKFSDRNLETAKYLYKNMRPQPLEIICYRCQQSAEKTLKAYLIYLAIKPERTHDLEDLRDKCAMIDNSFDEIVEKCERLNDYSSHPRYPFVIEITDGNTILAIQDSEK